MYALFAGNSGYIEDDWDKEARGGWRDLISVHKNVEPLLEKVSLENGRWIISKKEQVSWWHIINLTSLRLVRSNEFPENWEGMVKEGLITIDPMFRSTCEKEKPRQRMQV